MTRVREPKPKWIRAQFPSGARYNEIKRLLREDTLHTVCEEARCPNIGECFNRGTATFMILGDTCTRACGFCAVTSGKPAPLDWTEPRRLADAVARLNLAYVVITSVNRDDAADGGAQIFASCIELIRQRRPQTAVEVLIPDFLGDRYALETVLKARPTVLNHNVETVQRLYPTVRFQARYRRSLELLLRASECSPQIPTKTGFMLGLGEERDEVSELLRDLRSVNVDLLTVGQYLRPSAKHLPVDRYVPPQEFDSIREEALSLGFRHVESGPMTRSSYHADEQARAAQLVNVQLHA
ncbi:MAG: lipoyl synthase [Chloroflexi bacterium]|nr:lipoyl synthase [Chloroflexota bacterium]MYF21438.1 lipoyl synthase [Chloroflexota bacterium]